MRMNRRARRAPPYVPPTDARPLADVIREVSALNAQLPKLDEQIMMSLRRLERQLYALGIRRIVRVRLPDGAELAWSMNKYGHWRFVIRDEDAVDDLFHIEPEERIEILKSGALERLIKEATHGQAQMGDKLLRGQG